MRANLTTAEIFFAAFKALELKEREAFLDKVMSDAELRKDLMDSVLIDEARMIKGRAVPAKEYFAIRRKIVMTD